MGVVLAVLTSRLFGYAAIAASVVLGFLLVSADFQLRARNAQIATLGNQLTAEQLKTVQTAKAMSDFHAQVEMDAAQANAKALTIQSDLQTRLQTLQSTLNATEMKRRAASAMLTEALQNIPDAMQMRLSPGVLNYLAVVRDEQAAAAANAPGGGPNPQPLPARPPVR
jgi:hypothetical protein